MVKANVDPPLTLDELRGMDGEPVWVVCKPDAGGEQLIMCALVLIDREHNEIYLRNNIGGSSSYEDVLCDIEGIYRRKPRS